MPIFVESPDPRETLTWHPRRSAPALGAGDLHLWRIATSDLGGEEDQGLGDCLAVLGAEQRARALRMIQAAARGRYIRAQAGLRRILGLYLDCEPAALEFSYGPAGKPALKAGPPGFEFNLTTAADLALVGISLGDALGVDCERLLPRRALLAIAGRMFEPGIAQAITTLPADKGLQAFYRAWTALEADAKSDGRGLCRPRPPGNHPPEIRHCVPAPGYCAAVARAQVPPHGLWRTLELGGDHLA
jgi:4'-phosphopantetheinyl transferase